MKVRLFIGAAGLTALMSLMTSCDQKDLCMDHWEHTPKLDLNVGIDWQLAWEEQYPDGPDWKADWDAAKFGMTYESLLPKQPMGVRVMVYDADGSSGMSNLPANGGALHVKEGNHQLLFFNNDTEYIQFKDMESTSTAKASTRQVNRATIDTHEDESTVPGAEKTVSPPDYLFGSFVPDFDAERSLEPQYLDVTMKPLVVTYLIRYNFSGGFRYVGLARGALSGVAGSVYLSDGHTGPEAVTVVYDCELKNGYVEAKVNSFGAPDYPNPGYARAAHPYILNLELRLRNGKLMTFNFDVSDQMALQPRGGVIEVGGVVVPDQQGQESGGGFDIEVEGWGDLIDVPIMPSTE